MSNELILKETAKSIKSIRYETGNMGSKYAVVKYRRKSDGKVYRSRMIQGA